MKKLTFPILFLALAGTLGFCQSTDFLSTDNFDKITKINDTLVCTTDDKSSTFLQNRDYMLWNISNDTMFLITPEKASEYLSKSNLNNN